MTPGLKTPMTMKRIQREISDLKKEDLGDIILEPTDNLQVWRGVIPGPEGSVYEGGVFQVEIQLPNDYPFTAPKVAFKTRIYHMNISEQGGICIDILKNNWSPALSLFKVMLSLSSLLTDPNPKDPLVSAVASQYVRNRKLHDATARQWTETYARPSEIKRAPPTQDANSSLVSPAIAAGGSTTAASASSSAPTPQNQTSRPVRTSRQAAAPVAGPSTRVSATSAASAVTDEVIILDSDDDVSGHGSSNAKKRKRRGGRSDQGDNVVDLTDSDAERKRTVSKKQKSELATSRVASSSGSSSAASNGPRTSGRLSDVIVIDD